MESVKQSIDEMTKNFNEQMATFQNQLEKNAPTNPTVSSLAAEFNAFKNFTIKALEALQSQVKLLAKQVDQQEMRTRRKMLLFHGVTEAKDENTSERVLELLRKHLKSDLALKDIARSHRMGRPRGNQSRCILVKFHDLSDRDTVWYAKTALKGTGITLSEFLTKPRHDVFMAARDRFGVRGCFTRDGSVFVIGANNERRCVASLEDVNKIQVDADANKVEPGTSSNQLDKEAKRLRRQAAKLRT